MPEGHTIHREARLQTRAFVGKRLRVWSPQGRFSAGAELIDGQSLVSIDPWGKHLFYRWSDGHILHVHLGLFGRFRRHWSDPPEPTEGTRVAMSADSATQYLSGPTICEVIDPEHRDSILDRLGPDPLREVTHGAAVEHIVERLARRTVPIAVALLNQSVIAGLGNVYRSELLFRTGVNPLTESRRLGRERVEEIWSEAVSQLRAGEQTGRIVTTDPGDVGRQHPSDIAPGERTYVYKRRGQPCRRCGASIRRTEVASRKVWWCPECQPPRARLRDDPTQRDRG